MAKKNNSPDKLNEVIAYQSEFLVSKDGKTLYRKHPNGWGYWERPAVTNGRVHVNSDYHKSGGTRVSVQKLVDVAWNGKEHDQVF